MSTKTNHITPELPGIFRSLVYLNHQARAAGLNIVADHIADAIDGSSEWALGEIACKGEAINRTDKVAMLELITRFMSVSPAARLEFLRRVDEPDPPSGITPFPTGRPRR